MLLSDKDIKKAIENGQIKITPKIDFTTQLGSCSIDLRLDNTFQIFDYAKCPHIDTKNPKKEFMKKIVISKGEAFIMQPGEFALASTIESIELPDDLVGRIEGRSSLGRLGIIVHSTAAVCEPGSRGKIVMELGNLGKISVSLYPGMRICSLAFEKLSSPAEVPYYKKKTAKYIGQKAPTPSKISEEIV